MPLMAHLDIGQGCGFGVGVLSRGSSGLPGWKIGALDRTFVVYTFCCFSISITLIFHTNTFLYNIPA